MHDALEELVRHGAEPADRELAIAELARRERIDAARLRSCVSAMLAEAASVHVDGGLDVGGVPERIGVYRILGELGRGGMGAVYRAEQTEPVRREVALKVVQQGMATREVLVRFANERHALAAMSHRCIAKVFDAGATESGAPFFVMELVPGLPIDEYCDAEQLTIEQRIELMRDVCAGVQHAHQKGVIHRDLKPGNVLVAREGDAPVPKILDFGLAKATDRELVDQTLLTAENKIVGTPEFMAPEQAMGDGRLIDARADVYALGVMLYQLLSGELPFESAAFREQGLLEALRVIRDVEPQKPSSRLATTILDAEERAARRGESASRLARRIRGDLDWIVMRAMAKEPDRRYASAHELAEDLRRYLHDEPVLAGPPSTGYRVAKFVRRHRVQVVAAALVLLAVVAGGIAAWVGFRRASANATLAAANAARLEQRTSEFDQLAGVVLLERVRAAAHELLPAWPERIADIEAWLVGDVAQLRELRPALDATLERLAERASPPDAAAVRRARAAHPERRAYERAVEDLAQLDAAAAVRASDDGAPELVELSPFLAAADPRLLSQFSYARAGSLREGEPPRGDVATALAVARRALEAGAERAPEGRHAFLHGLAWASVAVGLDDEARAAAADAVAAAPPEMAELMADLPERIEAAIADAPQMRAAVAERVRAFEEGFRAAAPLRFEREEDGFLYETLRDLAARIDAFLAADARHVAEQDLRFARFLQEVATTRRDASLWAELRAGIAASPRYAGLGLDRLPPQTGLVPIGINPETGLAEFYHLRSAWDGRSDPAAIEVPTFDANGSIPVGPETGIVFVLIPGGGFVMGARPGDPDARETETPNLVEIDPFLIARHELTKAQWRRLVRPGMDPEPSFYRVDTDPGGFARITSTNPIEELDWWTARDAMASYGLELPTEAQWEFAAAGGTTTLYSCPADQIAQHANVADATGAALTPWPCETWNDGHLAHAPVGSFRPNPYGLFDVHGNVWEWCRDEFEYYELPARPGDGLRRTLTVEEGLSRTLRGGSFTDPAVDARTTRRNNHPPGFQGSNVGLRPAREIRW